MSSPEITAAELYADGYNNPKPNYYAPASHILKHLTYLTIEQDKRKPNHGKLVRKRLSTKARILLIEIIGTKGGDDKVCWKSERTLAKELGLSKGSISAAKKELMMKFEQIDHQPLITIDPKRKSVKKKTKEGETLSRGYSVTVHYMAPNQNFWRLSNGYMNSIKFQPKLTEQLGIVHNPVQEEGTSPTNESVAIGRAQHLDKVDRGRAQQMNHNNNPKPKNPSFKEQEPSAAGAGGCSYSSKEESGSVTDPGSYSLMMECSDWLRKYNVEDDLLPMIMAYNEKDISEAIKYTVKKHKNGVSKGKNGVGNLGLYVHLTLQKGWFKTSNKGCYVS